MPKPIAIFFAGCNGAGKSTLRDDILKSKYPFIDADFIAKQVNFSHLPNADIAAGREAIRRFRYYLQEKQSFSIETTLSGVSALNNMKKAKAVGFEVHLYYCGLASVELNIARVAVRVAKGGHNIAEDTIRRRYVESLQNLKTAMELADKYDIFDNSQRNKQHELCVVKDENRIHILRLPDWLKPYLPKNLLQQNLSVLTIEERLTQAQQLFKSRVDKLSPTERNKILAYEKGASEIWERLPDEKTRNALATNFYTNAARS
ncbi:MAG: zeta toxin family protein, partial [Neisseriaceae bacterium]|nr:zeta toxin family protein [Neisseriaceae bacterium]